MRALAIQLLVHGQDLPFLFSGHPFASSSNRFLPRFNRQRSNNAGPQDSKESQWAALKSRRFETVAPNKTILSVIMAERAAECLSKLGLESRDQPEGSNQMNAQTPNVVYNNQPPQTHLQVGTPTNSAQSQVNSVQIVSNQQSEQNSSSELNANGSNQFNAHHRR